MSAEKPHPHPEFREYTKGRRLRVKRSRHIVPGIPYPDHGKEAVVVNTGSMFVFCEVEGFAGLMPYYPEELVAAEDQ